MDYGHAISILEGRQDIKRLSAEELKKQAGQYGTKTEHGSYNFFSTVRNRSADFTVVVPSDIEKLTAERQRIYRNIGKTLERVQKYIEKAPFVCVERVMGDNNVFAPKCTLYLSVQRPEHIRLAYMFSQLFFDDKKSTKDSLKIMYIPEWSESERQILVFPEEGITYILGTDYFGEIKKGFLRLGMYHAKKHGMIGIHAATKLVSIDTEKGKKKYVLMFFGNSGTGKTTHSCHDHFLEEGKIEIAQDDVVFLCKDGSTLGTEKNFYIKTEDLEGACQRLLYEATLKKDAILDNVMVNHSGVVDLSDYTLTSNGRAVIARNDLAPHISESINTPDIDKVDGMMILFVTRRNTIIPILSKLSREQGAAAFMLGESIETSAGDPRKAGESIRVVGTNPFMIGDPVFEGNWFHDFINHHNNIECFLVNTGGVGEITERNGEVKVKQKVVRVDVNEMSHFIGGLIKGNIKWKKDENFNILIPEKVEHVDLEKFNLEKYYTKEQIRKMAEDLIQERKEYMKKFKGLDKAIEEAV